MELENSQRNFGTSKYDTFIIPNEELKTDCEVLDKLPLFHESGNPIKGYYKNTVKAANGNIYHYWRARIRRRGREYYKLFPYTKEGEKLAGEWHCKIKTILWKNS